MAPLHLPQYFKDHISALYNIAFSQINVQELGKHIRVHQQVLTSGSQTPCLKHDLEARWKNLSPKSRLRHRSVNETEH